MPYLRFGIVACSIRGDKRYMPGGTKCQQESIVEELVPFKQQTDIQETEQPEKAAQSPSADSTAVSESDKQAAASNANTRAAENQITGQIRASELQSQVPVADNYTKSSIARKNIG